MPPSVIALFVLPPLAWAALSDLCSRRVPNLACGCVAALWIAFALMPGSGAEIVGGLLGGATILAAGFLVWRLGHIGGGDVKLMGALALWTGGGLAVPFVLATAIAGGVLALVWLAARQGGALPLVAISLHRLGLPAAHLDRRDLPYGIAICAGGAWLLHHRFWT